MADYTYAQLMGLWIKNGGSRATAPIAAAIAEAESSGNAGATSGNPDGGTNVGLWQLDTPGGKGAGYTEQQLLDPATNAHVAVVGSNDGRDWSAWATYVSGAYKAFLSGRTTPDLNVAGGGAAAQQTGAVTVAAYNPGACLWSFPGIPVPIIGNIGQFCLFSKSEARAFLGVGLMAAGGLIMLPGVAIMVAAAGMRMLGAAGPVLEKTGAAVALIPGAEVAGVAIAGAGKAGTSSAEATQRRRSEPERRMQRELGEPREQPLFEDRGGTVRQTPQQRRAASSSRARARRAASAQAPATRAEAGY